MISAKIIADSINPDGDRLITVEGTFNRYILAEFNTHRAFSRNSASSRAIPVSKVLSQVLRNPAIPVHWGRTQKGMQARSELTGWRRWLAMRMFLWARLPIVVIVWILSKLKLHKQVANRLLEPWVWHTVVFTSTDWGNFFKLRLHPDAQPEFQEFAKCCKVAIEASVPRKLGWGDWHLPYTDEHDEGSYHLLPLENIPKFPLQAYASCARCARVSYVRQNEKREPAKDIEMAVLLSRSGHWSPFEHPAQAATGRHGNFTGWKQMRKFYPGEDGN